MRRVSSAGANTGSATVTASDAMSSSGRSGSPTSVFTGVSVSTGSPMAVSAILPPNA